MTAGVLLRPLAVLAALLGALAGCGAASPASGAAQSQAGSGTHAYGGMASPPAGPPGPVLVTRDRFAAHAEPALAVVGVAGAEDHPCCSVAPPIAGTPSARPR